jgi:hypothetical protein
MAKKLKLAAGEIKPLLAQGGSCIATDRITVEGYPVRFMYREEPISATDSGWRFLSGFESDAYMEEAGNHGLYELNTIANYDQSIMPFLEAPIGSAFEKTEASERFVEVLEWEPDED